MIYSEEIERIWKELRKLQQCKASCGILDNLTVDNGLTKTSNNIQLGGDLTENTVITNELGDVSLLWQNGNNVLDPVYSQAVDGLLVTSVNTTNNTLTYQSIGESATLTEIQFGHISTSSFENAVFQFGAGATNSDAKFILGTNETLGNTGLSWGVESWTDREQVNLYITDNGVDDIGRVNLSCNAALTSSSYEMYILDTGSYTGTANYGVQRIKADVTSGIVTSYKAQNGSYTYADQTLRSNFIIKDTLVFNKPAIGDVFTITKLGYIKATIPSYLNDALADADANLPSGGIYKLNAARTLLVKP